MTMTFASARAMKEALQPQSYRDISHILKSTQEKELVEWMRKNQRYWKWDVQDFLNQSIDDYDYRAVKTREEVIYRVLRDNPHRYWEFLIQNRIIELPYLWRRNIPSYQEALNQLEPMLPSIFIAFGLGNSYNNDIYKNSISILQNAIGMRPDGIYNQQTAEWLYQVKGLHIPKGNGYYSHEINPDLLFNPRYAKPTIYGVDIDIWRQMGFFYGDLTPDVSDYWQNPPIVSGALDLMSSFGSSVSARSQESLEYEQKKSKNISPLNKKLVSTYGTLEKFFTSLGYVFQLSEPIESYLAQGKTDRAQLVQDFSINAIESAGKEFFGQKAVNLVLKVVFVGGGGIAFTITAIALDLAIDWLIDKYILENKELQEAITAIMDRTKELITPFEEWIEEEHRKDLEAGIRMD